MSKPKFAFDVLFDSELKDFCTDKELSPIDKKKVLGLANDFESGKWQAGNLYNFLWDNVCETALSKSERDALIGNPATMLSRIAPKLRIDEQGGEIAEIFLYGVMKHHYKALPVVPKIFYKQNPKDYAKGADSVHIVLGNNEIGFSIWLGEAKFYSSIEDKRLADIIDSVEHTLSDGQLKKENSIILDLPELRSYLDDDTLYQRIVDVLDNRTSLDTIKPILHVPILLMYQCDITQKSQEYSEDYKQQIINFQKERAEAYFKKQIDKLQNRIFKYEVIHFHLVLFPVPDKRNIVNRFNSIATQFVEVSKND